jgi:hypothetical protein
VVEFDFFYYYHVFLKSCQNNIVIIMKYHSLFYTNHDSKHDIYSLLLFKIMISNKTNIK